MDRTTVSINLSIEELIINLIMPLPSFLEIYIVNACVKYGYAILRFSLDVALAHLLQSVQR